MPKAIICIMRTSIIRQQFLNELTHQADFTHLIWCKRNHHILDDCCQIVLFARITIIFFFFAFLTIQNCTVVIWQTRGQDPLLIIVSSNFFYLCQKHRVNISCNFWWRELSCYSIVLYNAYHSIVSMHKLKQIF